MSALVPIGEFSKMTYLSVKALRHYHDVGLLEPSEIDDQSGYRYYSPAQVPTAQAIRRFRDLAMPIEHIRTVLQAPDDDSRNAVIVSHLERMQQQLERTQQTVTALQSLLTMQRLPGVVELRTLAAVTALARTETMAPSDVGGWIADAYAALRSAAEDAGLDVAGDDSALYYDDFFQDDAGAVTAYVPVRGDVATASPSVTVLELPVTHVAVMVHTGPFDELDQTYGALGTYVSEHGIGVAGPIRELYLADEVVEVCWPIDVTRSNA